MTLNGQSRYEMSVTHKQCTAIGWPAQQIGFQLKAKDKPVSTS